jgi:hypothetical protein
MRAPVLDAAGRGNLAEYTILQIWIGISPHVSEIDFSHCRTLPVCRLR